MNIKETLNYKLEGFVDKGTDSNDVYATLSQEDLELIKSNFIKYADRSTINEVEQLRQMFVHGKIKGSSYGEVSNRCDCYCWVGSLAKIRKADVRDLEKDHTSLFERFIYSINNKDTPSDNHISKQVVEWVDKYLESKGNKNHV